MAISKTFLCNWFKLWRLIIWFVCQAYQLIGFCMPVSIWNGSCLINEISYQWATLRSVIFDFCLWIPWLSSVPLFPILCWLIIYCGCVHAYRFKNLLKLEAFLTWWFWVKNSRSICILFCVTHRRYSLCRIQVAVNERSLLCSVLFRALLCCEYISIENL